MAYYKSYSMAFVYGSEVKLHKTTMTLPIIDRRLFSIAVHIIKFAALLDYGVAQDRNNATIGIVIFKDLLVKQVVNKGNKLSLQK